METDRMNAEDLERWKINIAWLSPIMAARSAGVVSWASLSINSLILANSAAAGALLAFLAASKASQPVLAPALASIGAFGTGVFCGLLAAIFGYLSNLSGLERDFLLQTNPDFQRHHQAATARARLAGVFVTLSLTSFPIGALLGLLTLAVHGGLLVSW